MTTFTDNAPGSKRYLPRLVLPPNDLPTEELADVLISNVLDSLIDAQMPQLNAVSAEARMHAERCTENAAKRLIKANRPVWRTK